MSVDIPAEFQQFVQSVVQSGSFHSEAEVVGEALRLLQKRQTRLEELKAEIASAIDQLDRGEGIELDDESLDRFFDDIEVARTNSVNRPNGNASHEPISHRAMPSVIWMAFTTTVAREASPPPSGTSRTPRTVSAARFTAASGAGSRRARAESQEFLRRKLRHLLPTGSRRHRSDKSDPFRSRRRNAVLIRLPRLAVFV